MVFKGWGATVVSRYRCIHAAAPKREGGQVDEEEEKEYVNAEGVCSKTEGNGPDAQWNPL
jgi:hypothetical protein